MMALILIAVGIILWVWGAKKKGPKGNRSIGWFIAYIIGIIITVFVVGIFLIFFSMGLYKGAMDSYYREQAKEAIAFAKQTKSVEFTNRAIEYAQKSLSYGVPATAEKDLQVLQEAQQLLKNLQAQPSP